MVYVNDLASIVKRILNQDHKIGRFLPQIKRILLRKIQLEQLLNIQGMEIQKQYILF
ncbi:unnamed protein product [Paramecium sonneborni]|uniref:Uncharacterized protein n=1 Tax=Paramecium sonneborni TaxID=65129 RepID=A0A8S1MJY2_9CILI|nr:unnamed protein product [Paramecium sonneborni]